MIADNATNTVVNNDDEQQFDWSSPYSLAFILIISVLMIALSLLTVVGNLMVMISFYIDKNIRQPSNYFIFSLAVSDLMIGLEGFPFLTLYTLHGQKWTMGWFMCDLWLSVDYTVCLASIYTVLSITVDRYCSVKIPATYRNWRTKKRMTAIIILTWVVPALLFFVSVFGWGYFSGKGRILLEHECEVQFMRSNPYFNMSMYISYYWSTLVVIVRRLTTIINGGGSGESVILRRRRSSHRRHGGGGKKRQIADAKQQQQRHKKSKTENRARKALRTITIILGAFVLFWTPFYVMATIYGFCPECIPSWAYVTSYYMCYLNSPINPFCYAMANIQFKKTFMRMFRGDFHRA
uniref:G-protein coupled receptors family 1 profile domain-containing protein n=1 Tax=Romanomermis culicivorax TaxID=13658 RepID=A0A915JZ78_ROMCU